MAHYALINREGVFSLVMAGAAGFAIFHVGHAGIEGAGAVRKDLGMAINTLVSLQVNFVAEAGIAGWFGDLKGDNAGFYSFMALVAVSRGSKGLFTVVAGAA